MQLFCKSAQWAILRIKIHGFYTNTKYELTTSVKNDITDALLPVYLKYFWLLYDMIYD